MENNSDKNKRIAKNTLFLYFRSLVILVVNLYASRVVLETLGVEDYGIYNVVGGVVIMFSVLTGSLSTATQRFITFALGQGDFQKSKLVFSNSLILHVVLAVIVSVILEVAGMWMFNGGLDIPKDRVGAAYIVFHFSIVAFFINMISIPYNALITAHEKMKAFACIGVLECILKLLAALFLYICWYDKLVVYALLIMLISVSIRFVYSFYCKKHFNESRNIKIKFEKNLFKEMFAFAGWNFFGHGSLALRNQGVDVILNVFFGVTINAAKGLSNQIQHAVMLLVQNFQTAVRPQLTKAVAQGDNERVFFLINQGSRFSFYLMMVMAVPVMIATPDLLRIWLNTVPDYTVDFIRWSLIYLLLDTQSRFHIHAILSMGKIRNYEMIVGGTKLLAVPLVLTFLMCNEAYWNWKSAALIGFWVNIFLEIICFAERLFFNKKLLNFPSGNFLKKIFIPNWFTFAVSLVPPMIFCKYVSQNVFLSVLVSIASSLLCIAIVGMTASERQKMMSKVIMYMKK